jgi:serine/threonine protein kinase
VDDPLIGLRLGNYQIKSLLGQGGMARVYEAVDVMLKRRTAIKVIEPNLTSEAKYTERFEREAQAIANLEHPHIIPVYHFGQWQHSYYLAMKFVDGEDLGTLMHRYADDSEYLPEDDIVRIISAIGDALDYAHQKGLIHRDVKPSNVMIDRTGHPYLTDFGLALDVSQGTVGEVFGSPHYIAPEQARNSANAVPQSDLYALGVILFELFTGTVPFDDPSPATVALQHVVKAPPEPCSLNPGLSSAVETVILKALNKKPEDRYQNGAELTQALKTALKTPRPNINEASLSPILKPSTTSVIDQVRVSLTERPPSILPTRKKEDQPKSPGAGFVTTQVARNSLPWIVLSGVLIVVILVVGAVAITIRGSNTAQLAEPLPTVAIAAQTTIEQSVFTHTPTVLNVAVPTSTLPPVEADLTSTPTETSTSLPTATPYITATPAHTATPTVSASATPPATSTIAIAPTETSTSMPANTATPEGPTPAPAGWLPVRFVYDDDAFYWMNDSDRTISSEPIAFERIDGSERFEGNRFAFYTMEPGRCMQIMFADVARQQCPEGRRPNAFFTPTRTQGVSFWTEGRFRVLWQGTEIAVCRKRDGVCVAFIPPR